MKVDVYGSRSFLLNLLNIQEDLNISIFNAFTGTTIESQLNKEIKIDKNIINEITSLHEQLELTTDLRKRFKTQYKFSKSKVLLLDFMQEGKESIKFKEGIVTNRPVLKRYGFDIELGKTEPLDKKVNNIYKYVDILIESFSSYDHIILNRGRTAKYTLNNNEKKINKNIHEVNFLNYYAETFEDILLKKYKDIHVIPLFQDLEKLYNGYLQSDEYRAHLKKHLKCILNSQFKNV